MNRKRNQSGMVLASILIMLIALSSIYAAYYQVTRFHVESVKSSKSVAYGFYSAEAALNARIEVVRTVFTGFNLPSGSSPSTSTPCEGGDNGSGDMACQTATFGGRTVYTYVEDVTGGTPVEVTIPEGDPFAGLVANEYRYDVKAEAKNVANKTEAILGMRIVSRVIPMFQFATFYENDLEINAGPAMQVLGPVHSNSSIYLASFSSNSSNKKQVEGPISAVGSVYGEHKHKAGGIYAGLVEVNVPEDDDDDSTYAWRAATFSETAPNGKKRMSTADMDPYGGHIEVGVDPVVVPDYGNVSYGSGPYWNNADIRIVFKRGETTAAFEGESGAGFDNVIDDSCAAAAGASNTYFGIEVQDTSGNCEQADTKKLIDNCIMSGNANYDGAVQWINQMHNYAEDPDGDGGGCWHVMNIDVRELLNCLHAQALVDDAGGNTIGKADGVAIFLGFDNDNMAASGRDYSVKLMNAETVQSTVGGPSVQAITFATDLPMYVHGNYNGTYRTDPENNVNKIPSALVGDRMWALSPDWNDTVDGAASDCTGDGPLTLTSRGVAGSSDMGIYSGLYFKLPITCSSNSSVNCDDTAVGDWNGALQNYPVIMEDWKANSVDFLVHGAFVSLGTPNHATDPTAHHPIRAYWAPTRLFSFDQELLDNPPPIAPKFVHIKQELFVRYFE